MARNKLEYSKKDIIVKLMQQCYTQVDTIRHLKELVSDLEKDIISLKKTIETVKENNN
jgi:hypothetical protein